MLTPTGGRRPPRAGSGLRGIFLSEGRSSVGFVIGGRVGAVVEQVAAGIDALLALPLDGDDVPELVRAVEVQRRRFEAVDQRLIAELTRAGHRDALAALTGIDAREARAREKRAGDLGPRHALTGEPIEPILPRVAAAVERGEVSAAQADVIIACLERIPPTAPARAWPVAEGLLVEAARVEPPRVLRRTAEELLARLDPDGLEPVEDKIERRRGFALIRHRDGSATPRGTWTAELAAHWEAIFDSLAAPRSNEEQPDDRTAAQRRHDALLEAARRLLRSGELPTAGGVPVTVLATITMRELAAAAGSARSSSPTPRDLDLGLGELAAGSGLDLATLLGADTAGLAELGHGQTVSAKALLTMACDAQVVPVVFNDAGGILAYGTTRRLASSGQRLALAARDRGCSFPGCDRPPAWCEVHHVVEWSSGGPTDLDNLCLACVHHHHAFAKAGWQVDVHDGVPWWTPPPWIDPEQRPLRNTVRHRPEIVFREPVPA